MQKQFLAKVDFFDNSSLFCPSLKFLIEVTSIFVGDVIQEKKKCTDAISWRSYYQIFFDERGAILAFLWKLWLLLSLGVQGQPSK